MSCMSATLSDRKVYPNFFRTVQSDLTTNPGYISLLKHFGWKKVTILSLAVPSFTSVYTIYYSLYYIMFKHIKYILLSLYIYIKIISKL